MVMADYDNKSRTRYKKDRDESNQPLQIKIPTILTKLSVLNTVKNGYVAESGEEFVKDLTTLNNKENTSNIKPVQNSVHQNNSTGLNGLKHLVLNGNRKAIKIFDEILNHTNYGYDILGDQSNFLVVGVIGQQGVGKSTILSSLAALNIEECEGFAVNSRESTRHMTNGVEMIVTNERMIILDTQPVLSQMVINQINRNERKYAREAREFSSLANQLEIVSIQSAAFMLSVCNVILIVVDSFIDEIITNLIHVCELVKPIKTTENDTTEEIINQNAPHIIFILNNANVSSISTSKINEMNGQIKKLMASSKFNYIGLKKATVALPSKFSKKNRVICPNICILPKFTSESKEGFRKYSLGSAYSGNTKFEEQIVQLKREIFALPHTLPFNKLTEKKWLQYASRVADSLKKNPMMPEYARLLSQS